MTDDQATLAQLQADARAERRAEAAQIIRRIRRNEAATRALGLHSTAAQYHRDARALAHAYRTREDRLAARDRFTLHLLAHPHHA